MNFTQTALAVSATAIFGQLGIELLPQPSFMVIHDVTYSNGYVTADRTVVREQYADWRVTVVENGKDAPICATIPGPSINEGWSLYEEGRSISGPMSFDDWVGDLGCYDRMSPGKYTQYITWTPRGEKTPVFGVWDFVKE